MARGGVVVVAENGRILLDLAEQRFRIGPGLVTSPGPQRLRSCASRRRLNCGASRRPCCATAFFRCSLSWFLGAVLGARCGSAGTYLHTPHTSLTRSFHHKVLNNQRRAEVCLFRHVSAREGLSRFLLVAGIYRDNCGAMTSIRVRSPSTFSNGSILGPARTQYRQHTPSRYTRQVLGTNGVDHHRQPWSHHPGDPACLVLDWYTSSFTPFPLCYLAAEKLDF